MNHRMFLSKIHIPSFKNYIYDFSLDIPDEPGLTVIVGANGLGKSTILNGIEWGLTGKIERVEKAPNTKEIDRSRSIGTDASVELFFNNDFTIRRDANLTNESIRELDKYIRKYLIDPNWESLDDLAASLQFTHFRGQSALQHFTNQDSGVRFQRIKGASRLGELIDAQQKLERRKTSTAFSSVKKSLDNDRIKLIENIQMFKELISEKKRLSSLARAENALSPDEIMSALSEIKSKCDEVGIDVSLLSETLSLKADIPVIFEEIQKEFQAKKTQYVKADDIFTRWVSDAEDYEALRREVDRQVENQKKVKEKFQAAENEWKEAVERQERLGKESIENRNKWSSLSKKLEKMQELKTCFKDQASQKEDLTKIEDSVKELRVRFKSEEELLAKSEMAYSEALSLLDKIKSVRSEMRSASEIMDVYSSILRKRSGLNELFTSYEESKETIFNCSTIEKDLDGEIGEIRTKRIELERSLNDASKNVELVQAAVATIASELTEEEQVCPVCTTQHAKGVLKRIAQEAADRNSPKILEIEKELKVVMSKYNELCVKQEDLNLQREAANEIIKQYDDLKRTIDEEIESLLEFEMLDGINLEDVGVTLEQMISDAKNLLSELENEKLSRDEYKALSDVVSRLRESCQTINKNVELSEEKERQLRNLIIVSQGRAEALIDELDISNESLGNLDALIKALARSAASMEQQLKSSEANELESKELTIQKEYSKNKFSEDLGNIRDLIESKKSEIENFNKNWAEDGFDGDPSTIRLKEKAHELNIKKGVLKSLEKKHMTLLDSYKSWQDQEGLKKVERKIIDFLSKLNVDSQDEALEYFSTEEEKLNKKEKNLQKANDARDELIKKIRERLENVERDTFQPLNQVLEKFSSALMTGWDFQLLANAEFRKSKSAAGVVLRTPENINLLPELTLSEGQMAAMELSLMFSASEIYPWSPWKALVLDDPLQHNDTIHAASFIDVVRNMIKERGYQVILTTHDVDEASYFLRKCRNVGVTTQYCHLLSKIDDKLMYSIG